MLTFVRFQCAYSCVSSRFGGCFGVAANNTIFQLDIDESKHLSPNFLTFYKKY